MYCGINRWAYFREKSKTSIQKRGVGVFLRVGLFSGDYGTTLVQVVSYTFSITCALSVWVTVGVGVHTGGVTNITVLGTCTVSRRTRVELQDGTRDTGSNHSPETILWGGGNHMCEVNTYSSVWWEERKSACENMNTGEEANT